MDASIVDQDRLEGTARTIGGRLQDAVGGLTGDVGTQMQGKANQLAGKAQNTLGAAADEAREIGDQLAAGVQQKPLAALLIAGALGFALGFVVSK